MPRFRTVAALAAVVAVVGVPCVSPAQRGSAPPAVAPVPLPAYMSSQPLPQAGAVYDQYDCFSPKVKNSYIIGSTPAPTSMFVNPREYPKAVGAIATPYTQYGGMNGWYFGAPRIYEQSTVAPMGSNALRYFRGELGFTDNLSRGYPEGQRVVEPVVVPYANYSKASGYFIQGATPAVGIASPTPLPVPGGDGYGGNGGNIGACAPACSAPAACAPAEVPLEK